MHINTAEYKFFSKKLPIQARLSIQRDESAFYNHKAGTMTSEMHNWCWNDLNLPENHLGRNLCQNERVTILQTVELLFSRVPPI